MIQIFPTKCHPTSHISASCGHDITNKLAFSICIKDITIDYGFEKFVNCTSDMVVCFKCFIHYLSSNLIIFTESGRNRWLYGRR